jgi:aminoglycoside phosphotransferase (APT) family kinase protein
MKIVENHISKIAENLLYFLREEIGDSKIGYEIPPSQLQGGFDTSIFKFKLKNAQQSLLKPLVLRIFRNYHQPKQAIKESVVHNSMVEQGFPVPYIHFASIDEKYLGSQFLIMDFMTGALLPTIFNQDTPIKLGNKHAMLHNADPSQLSEALTAAGFGGRQYRTEGRLDYLIKVSEHLPWLEEIVCWLVKNKPPNCEQPSICHGDFHPYNLLAKNGEVTAILDWSSCSVGDPAADVASTWVIFNAATKHLIESFDATGETQKYLDAYKCVRDLDEQHLQYYQALFSAFRLFIGIKEVVIYTQVPIRNELIDIIYDLSKIHIDVPG